MLEDAKNLIEIVTFIAAAVFLLYKLFDGWGLVNLSLELSAVRHEGTQTDRVVVGLKLVKGDRGSLELHTVELRCTQTNNGHQKLVRIPQIYRLGVKADGGLDPKESRIQWNIVDQRHAYISLPPGESTQYSHTFDIPHAEPCSIEAIVVGKRPVSTRQGQWRASITVG